MVEEQSRLLGVPLDRDEWRNLLAYAGHLMGEQRVGPLPMLRWTAHYTTRRSENPKIRPFQAYSGFLHQGHDERARAKESIDEHWPYYERAGDAAAMIRQVRSLDVNDTLSIADRIPNIGVPARIVWGVADQFQKIGYGYRFAYELGAPLDRSEEGKHFVPEDHPERVAAVNDLLRHTATGE